MDEFMTGGESLEAVKFLNPGDTITGVIRNVTKLEDKTPDGNTKRWDNGDPMHVWVFDLDTTNTGQADKCVWVRGNLVKVLKQALQEANLRPQDNPQVTIKFDKLGEPTRKGFYPPKLYKAKAEPAKPAVDMADF